jgi:hypothetical protein
LLTIGNTAAVQAGDYTFDVVGQSLTSTHTVELVLHLDTAAPATPILLAPSDGAQSQPVRPAFAWQAGAQSTTFDIQIAAEPRFQQVVDQAYGLTDPQYSPSADLNSSQVYFWRVRASNLCGDGSWSAVYSFVTASTPGDCGLGATTIDIFKDTFETGAAGWTHSGLLDTWSISSERTHSGAKAFRALDPAFVSDQRLVSPPITLPVSASPLQLQFWNYQSIESNASLCGDGGLLEISTDGGANWTQVGDPALLSDPYDGLIDTYHGNPLKGLPAWCGDPQDWLNSVVDLSPYTNQTINLRFRLGSNVSVSKSGWFLDDVAVRTCQTGVNAVVWPDSSIDSLPGMRVTHHLKITNLGATDTFSLTLSGNSWFSSIESPDSLALPSGSSADVIVNVDVPSAFQEVINGSDVFTITARAASDPQFHASATGTTRAVTHPAVSLAAQQEWVEGQAGETVTHTFSLQNNGDYTDTYALSVAGNAWQTWLSQDAFQLSPGQVGEAEVLVNVLAASKTNSVIVGSDGFTLTATSQLDPAVFAQSTGLTYGNATPAVSLGNNQAKAGLVGSAVTYQFTLTNTGNYQDTFTLEVSGNQWDVDVSQLTIGPLPAGGTFTVSLTVHIPPGVASGTVDIVTFKATSGLDGSAQATVQATTTARLPLVFLPLVSR